MNEPNAETLQEDLTLLSPPAPLVPGTVIHQQTAHQQQHVLLTAGVVLALAAVLAWTWYRYRRSWRRGEAPDLVALRELSAWESLSDPGRFREAVSGTSGTLRRFVYARFGSQAPSLTSEQLREEQAANRLIPDEHMVFWNEFLDRGDAIKYAGHTPTAQNYAGMMSAALAFVRKARGKAVQR